MSGAKRRRRCWAAVSLLLVFAVAAIYGQTRNHAFLNYDDDVYITANPVVTGGFTTAGLGRAWGVIAVNWHPLTWYSHRLDWALFGNWAGGHHLVSAALHAANAVLLFVVLAAVTGSCWPSAAVAALFALHPLRVESVAWASERKDVLSALFWLATMGAYLRHVRRPGMGRYLAVAGLFALGLTAKPMLVTLPFVLLLLDWWPLGRTGASPGSRSWRGLVLEKVPLFALAFAASVTTYVVQIGSSVPMIRPELGTRLANAVVSYARYLFSFVWPERLAFFYPFPRAGVPAGELAAAAAVLAAISTAVLLLGRRRPWLLVGWLWYLGTLVPVIGIVQVGAQARSDRYTYLTMIGVTLALVWTAAAAAARRPALRRVLAALFCILCVGLAARSFAYVHHWRSSLALMSYSEKVTEGNSIVLVSLGLALMDEGRTLESVPYLWNAVQLQPEDCNAQYDLGLALLRLVRYAEAREPLKQALACYQRGGHRDDWIADAHLNLGAVELNLGRAAAAAEHYRAAYAIDPSAAAAAGLRAAQARQDSAFPRPR